MAKVYPAQNSISSYSSSAAADMTTRRETFTIWMKSLVFNGNGCTVYNSNGEVVYRIDNYDSKCTDEEYLMDLRGKVLFTIRRKKLRVLGRWEGHRSEDGSRKEKPLFQVRRRLNKNILKRNSPCGCEVSLGCNEQTHHQSSGYRIEELLGKSAFKIVDKAGRLVAEIKRKQSSSGVMLGDDVLTLVVAPHTDRSLIMSIVVVYGLINRKL